MSLKKKLLVRPFSGGVSATWSVLDDRATKETNRPTQYFRKLSDGSFIPASEREFKEEGRQQSGN